MRPHSRYAKTSVAVLLAGLLLNAAVAAQVPSKTSKIKVIADQDSAGPHGTNFLSLLMLLNAPQVDLLGITTISGDQWVDPATVFALHAVELAGRSDVPVVKGAEKPLIKTARSQELSEALYGSHATWHGSFNPDTPAPAYTWEPPGGYPETKPHPGRAADFIIDTIRANPGEIVLYMGGPLTNLALAVRMDPGIVPLIKALYIMGASVGGEFELNWWWDPEAVAIVMREAWPKIVITSGEIGFTVISSEQLMRRVVDAGSPFAEHIQALYLDYAPSPGLTQWSAMWDELAVAAMIDPSIITETTTMWLDADISHGPSYGDTVVWTGRDGEPNFFLAYSGPGPIDRSKWKGHFEPPAHLQPAEVQTQVDIEAYEKLFVELMTSQ